MPILRDPAAGPADYELLGELARRHLVEQTMPICKQVVLNIDPNRFLQAMAKTDSDVSMTTAEVKLQTDLSGANPTAFAIDTVYNDNLIIPGRPGIGRGIIGVAWQVAIVLASAGLSAWLVRLWIYG